MRILFVTVTPYLIEPLGVMLLGAIARREGHETKLVFLRRVNLLKAVRSYRPDVIAYSTPSADVPVVREADAELRAWLRAGNQRLWRVMGGPHPTYAPEICDEMELDAICQGDGDRAFPEMLRRLEAGESLRGIPNVALNGAGAEQKEVVQDLDALPRADRELYYTALPYCGQSGLRTFMASRGCPYDCSYCFNHLYREVFAGHGPILRRRSVDNLLDEIDDVRRRFPPMRLIRFMDDTFTHRVDPWLEEFAEKYRARINVPFYCLMRSNTLTEATASLLAGAGCRAIGMSIEAGDERARNEILHRNLRDDLVRESFAIARKYGLHTYAATMVGLPGTTLENDFLSLDFVRDVQPSAPIFVICSPYKGTEIWRKAVEQGQIDAGVDVFNRMGELSAFNCFSQREKEVQARVAYLGPLYCKAPRLIAPLIRRLMTSPLPLPAARAVGTAYTTYRIATRIFPQAVPRSPRNWVQLGWDSIRYLL